MMVGAYVILVLAMLSGMLGSHLLAMRSAIRLIGVAHLMLAGALGWSALQLAKKAGSQKEPAIICQPCGPINQPAAPEVRVRATDHSAPDQRAYP